MVRRVASSIRATAIALRSLTSPSTRTIMSSKVPATTYLIATAIYPSIGAV